jgi:hypothetical protein
MPTNVRLGVKKYSTLPLPETVKMCDSTTTNVNRLKGHVNDKWQNTLACFAPASVKMLKKVLKQWLQTATLLASLDKSILQIRDWLTLLEDMLKKEKVDLSDLSHICHLLERQRVSTLIEFYTSLI